MPVCPICSKPMAVAKVISLAGVQNKAVSWRCPDDDVEVSGVHPVQMPFLHVGDERVEEDGRRSRLIKLDMAGAELLVFRKFLGEEVG